MQTRREFFAIIAALAVYRPELSATAHTEQPDFITYWLFRFDEAATIRDYPEALTAARNLLASIQEAGVPREWRRAYFALQHNLTKTAGNS